MEQRRFGVELEVHAKFDRFHIATLINESFTAAHIRHRCRTAGYHHNVDSSNESVWEVKTDISIGSGDFRIPSRIRNDYNYDAEIVSPVLKGTDGLKALKIVCAVLNPICEISRNCGLHVHHEIKEPAKKVKKLINAWIDNEEHFYKAVPKSRSKSRYCRSWKKVSYSLQKISDSEQIRSWYRNNRFGRYVGLNVESYFLRGTFEFRLAAGTTSFEKISNWILVTQIFVSKALNGKIKKNNTLDDMINNLKGKAVRLREGSRPWMLYNKITIDHLTYNDLFEDVELLAKYNDNINWINNDYKKLFNDEYSEAADWMKKRSLIFS